MSSYTENTEQPQDKQQQLINPLQKKLTPDQFQASVNFYEADHALNNAERESIADDLQAVVTLSSVAGYGLGMAAFGSPTIYRKLTHKPSLVAGVKNVGIIHKPMVSFMMGLAAMIVAHQLVAKWKFNSQIQQLEGNSEKTRQLNVWKTMDYHQAGLFFLYYKQSCRDSSYIIKDPRTYSEHEVQFHPSVGERDHFTSAIGIGAAAGSLWDQIRKANGIDAHLKSEKDVEHDSNGSAWDKIRKEGKD